MGFCKTLSRGAVAIAALGLVACDSNMPTTFDPAATAADVNAMNGVFEAPISQSFAFASASMDDATGSAAAASVGLVRSGMSPRAQDGARYVARLRSLLAPEPTVAFSASSAGIPPEAQGKTFVYSTTEGRYVVSAEPGAPSDGVRFVLYAVDPVTQAIVEPLNEIGYADITENEGNSSYEARVIVVSGSTTYLDYEVNMSATSSGGEIDVQGFVSDGSERANFNVETRIDITDLFAGESSLNYSIDVPSRSLSFDADMTVAVNGDTGNTDVTLELTFNGPNGRVDLAGAYAAEAAGPVAGTVAVEVNGNPFATINVTETTLEIVGRDGAALTAAERDALERIFDAVEDGFDILDRLLRPVDSFAA